MRAAGLVGLIAVSAMTAAGSAMAADLAPRAVEPVAPLYAPFSWTGFYAGVQGGYVWGDSTLSVGASTVSLDPKGAFGGIHAGYNYQFDGSIVLGAEADVNLSAAKSDSVAAFRGILKSDLKWFGSTRLRAGYAIDRFLPYLTGGLAFAGFDHDFIGGGGTISLSDTYFGWTAGAGLEYAFTDNLTGRVEYRYTDYGSQSYTLPGTHQLDLKTSDVRVGISYKF